MQAVGTVSKILLDSTKRQVFNLACNGQSVRVVSDIDIKIAKGDPIAVSGQAVNDPTYGQQLEANDITYVPISEPLLRGFLKTGTGIGDAIVDRLLAAYGFNLIDVLEKEDIDALCAVERISEAIAVQLCQTWHSAKGKVELIRLLEDKLKGHPKKTRMSVINSAMKAYRVYGELTSDKLTEDPYRLWSFATWKQTEILAQVMGIESDDERRLICAVEEALHQKTAEGHTLVHPNDFSDVLARLVGEKLMLPAIEAAYHASAEKPPRIILTEVKEKPMAKTEFAEKLQNSSEHKSLYHRMFSLVGVSMMERYVEQQLKERLSHNMLAFNVSDDDISDALSQQCMIKHGLTKEQKNAVKMVLSNGVSLVRGPAGTGKTSVLYVVNAIIKSMSNSVLQVALAGKAAQRLVQQTDEKAYTIKSLLTKIKYHKEKDGTYFLDSYPMPVLHIDEASMVDLQTMYQVLKAFEGRDARFVFIGDPAQLPPIGLGLIFHQLIKSELVPQVELTENFRSVKDICLAANKIRFGKVPPPSENVVIIRYTDKEQLVELVKQHYLQHKDTSEVHVVAARKSTVGLINTHLHTLLTRERDAIHIAPQFSIGDSVIYKTNDADLGLTNGSTGIVEGESVIHTEFGKLPVLNATFNGMPIQLKRHEIQDDENGIYHLQHAYSITCHAAQGSEFGTVIVVVEKSKMVERSWLYTALTRAKHKVILLVENNALQCAVDAGFKADEISVGLSI
ncbi:MAG: AAA family ATPase [Alteromonadaceae bacterium]|nr:AAA family ATPase [Alteromonadaceae bacterium]